MGSGALQITISLFAILGAAGLALVCDYLRHRNEELKAAMAALRNEAGTSQAAKPTLKKKAPERVPTERSELETAALDPKTIVEPEPVLKTPESEEIAEAQPAHAALTPSRRPRRRRPVDVEIKTEIDRTAFIERALNVAAEIASREPSISTPELEVTQPVVEETPVKVASLQEVAAQEVPAQEVQKSPVVPVLQEMGTDAAMKGWLSRRAAARIALQHASSDAGQTVERVPHLAGLLTVQAVAPFAPPAAELIVKIPEPMFAEMKEPVHVSLDHKLWTSVFHDEPKLVLVNRKERAAEKPAQALPPGIHDAAAFARLLASDQPFTGLVICISVQGMEERVVHGTLASFLTGLTRPGETLCRTTKEEFVLLCPYVRGSDSRRRLGSVSEQLWDYQLRNLSNFSALFSWGGEDAWCARLEDALDSARVSIANTRRKKDSLVQRKAV